MLSEIAVAVILPTFEHQFEKLFNSILYGKLKFQAPVTQCKLVENSRATATTSLLCPSWRCSSSSGWRPQRSLWTLLISPHLCLIVSFLLLPVTWNLISVSSWRASQFLKGSYMSEDAQGLMMKLSPSSGWGLKRITCLQVKSTAKKASELATKFLCRHTWWPTVICWSNFLLLIIATSRCFYMS